MIEVSVTDGFDGFRVSARRLLSAIRQPEEIVWRDADAAQPLLEGMMDPGQSAIDDSTIAGPIVFSPRVPREYVELARVVACNRSPERWSLLYRILWRLTQGEKHLLRIAVDPDVHRMMTMYKQVRRDRHKMTAFVRFRQVTDKNGASGGTRMVAWYEPDHRIVRLTAPFFARRFATMHWSILTSDQCAHWDGQRLLFSPGLASNPLRATDEMDELWRTYYRSIFNPARVKERAMKREMPVRFWKNLPEAADIDDLLRTAARRVESMVHPASMGHVGAAQWARQGASIDELRASSAGCQGCPLYACASKAVFGEGPSTATAMVIGEQPGDEEDRAGRPFVGPAGRLLDEGLARVGLDRASLYVTNTVKHFKFEQRGKRRIHSKPSARELAACAPWLKAEIAAIKPRIILCLGATAAQTVLGRDFRLTAHRGQVLSDHPAAKSILATYHPAALLRIPDLARRAMAEADFITDLTTFASLLLRQRSNVKQ